LDNINELVEKALSNTNAELVFVYKELSLPIYGNMPDFGSDEPEAYIVYSLYNIPVNHADDDYLAIEYTLTVNVFVQTGVKGLEKAIRSRMKAKGFEYQGSGTPIYETDYPEKCRYVQEYKITIEEE